jgi:phosphohistidine phosphatase SixA
MSQFRRTQKKAEIVAKVLKEALSRDDGQTPWTGPGHTYMDYVQAYSAKRLPIRQIILS